MRKQKRKLLQRCSSKKTKTPPYEGSKLFGGGELGIRTLDTLVAYTRLAGEHLRPLGQLSKIRCDLQ